MLQGMGSGESLPASGVPLPVCISLPSVSLRFPLPPSLCPPGREGPWWDEPLGLTVPLMAGVFLS